MTIFVTSDPKQQAKPEISVNPLEGLKDKVSQKQAVLGIVGLGYVGLPLAVASSAKQVKTIGFDVHQAKIDHLQQGCSYLGGFDDEIIQSMTANGLFQPTSQIEDLKAADFILLCVPTPLTQNNTPDMRYITDACEMLVKVLRPGQVVILESTTYPGTTKELMVPILEKSGLICDYDFFVAYSPEREDPGNAHFSTDTIPKVVGADHPEILKITAEFYGHFINKVVTVSSSKTAEAVKLVENIFRCVNIALVNELKMTFDHLGIDVFEVIDAAATKPFGFMPFYPGPGIGGHCIPIDPLYLSWKMSEYKDATRFIQIATEINQKMPIYTVQKFSEQLSDQTAKSLNGANVLIVGLAYKKNVSDLRESPALDIVNLLKQRKANIFYYDPFVTTTEGTEYTDITPINWAAEDISKMDGAIIVTDHSDIDWQLLMDHTLVYDTRGVTRKIS